MDETTAPWRALEAGPQPPAVNAVAAPAAGKPWLAIALAGAGILIGAAVWLAATGNTGSVAVEGFGPDAAVQALGGELERPGGSAPTQLVIDVQGAVARPGIVRLPAGARIADAIAAAGGFGPRVAADRVSQALNLAAVLRDGDQVVVPSRDDPATPSTGASGPDGSAGGSGVGAGGGASGPVDLNRASAGQLDALPGIGPVTAAKIIAAREERPFASLEDLQARKVLGASTLEKIRDLVVVR